MSAADFWRPVPAETWKDRPERASDPRVAERVSELLAALRAGGSEALARLEGALRADPGRPVEEALAEAPLAAEALELAPARMGEALGRISPDLRAALEASRRRLREFLAPGLPRPWAHEDGAGNRTEMLIEPLTRVGAFVPGGRAAYVSSLLMTVVPARLAGVGEVVVCTPVGPDGSVSDALLAAAAVAEVDRVFTLGAVPAVAAMALGLDPVPACAKVVGPGSAWVVEAKRQLFGTVGLDGLPGPSEVMVVASTGANPDWVALDLLAQAEHGPDTLSLLVTPDADLAEAVGQCLERRWQALPPVRRRDAALALASSGGPVLVPNVEAALALAAQVAPEHLALQGPEAEAAAGRARGVGAVFVGPWSPVAAGDYAAGTDHVLPTRGTARHASGLSCADFVRQVQVFRGSPRGTGAWGPAALVLAREEGFVAHAASVAARLEAMPAGLAAAEQARPYVPPIPGGALRLDLNENPYPWPDELWEEVLVRLRAAEPSRYPRGTARLQEALAAYAGVPAERCLPANGSDELLLALVAAWGRRVARVLFPTPTFGMYRRLAEAAGLPAVGVPLGPAPGWELDVDRLVAEARRGGETLLFLCRPNNPTGGLWPADQVRRLVETEGVWTVLDEAYAEFSGESLQAWIDEYPRLCVLRTMSKAFALAGLRVGYALGRGPALAWLRAAVQPWAVSAFSCAAAEAALERRPLMEAWVRTLTAERERLGAALAGIPGLEPYPSQANYILFGVDPVRTGWQAPELFARLYRDGAVLRRWDGEPALAQTLRVSVGRPEENDRLVGLLEAAVQERRSDR